MEEQSRMEKREPVDIYLEAIQKLPPLTREKKQTLIRSFREGDKKAAGYLACDYLELVVSIAREYKGRGLNLLDLIQEGNNGLLRAAETFSWENEAEFESYAGDLIHKFILRAFDESCICRRIPEEKLKQLNWAVRKLREAEKQEIVELDGMDTEEPQTPPEVLEERTELVIRTVRELERSTDRTITLWEIAEAAKLSADETREAIHQAQLREDFDAVIQTNPNAELYRRCRAGVSTGELKHFLASCDMDLSERQWSVLELRFGLNGEAPRSLEETAQILGVTRERVRQIEHHIFRRRNSYAPRKKIKEFYR